MFPDYSSFGQPNRKTPKVNGIIGWLIMVAMLHTAAAAPAGTGDIEIVPSIALKQEYNDNIDFDTDDPEDDFITTLTPGMALERRTERWNAGLSASLSALSYADNSDLNTVDQHYNGRLSYQLTPRMSVSGEAGYTIDSRPDRDIETTGLTLSGDRKMQNYLFSWNYLLTEKTQITLYWAQGHEDIEKPDDEENRSCKIGLGMTHDLSDFLSSTVARMNLSYTRYDSEDHDYHSGISFLPVSGVTQELHIEQDSDFDIYQCTVGGSRRLSELFEVSVDAGMSYTCSAQDIQYVVNINGVELPWSATSDEWNNWGFVGNAALSYSGEYTHCTTTLAHDIRTASGENGTTERTSLSFYGSRRFDEKLRIWLGMGYYRNCSDRKAGTETEKYTFRITPGIRYDFSRDFFTELSYHYTNLDDKESEQEEDRNQLCIRIQKEF